MTTALILLIVVLINHLFPKIPVVTDFITLRGAYWLKFYINSLLNMFKKASMLRGEIAAVLVILPIPIITFLIIYLFNLLLKGWGYSFFTMAILYYCLNAHTEDDDESMLVVAHERAFGIIFWFSVLGAPGAMLYWMLTISKGISEIIVVPIANFQRGLNIMHALVAWVPARITGLIYALVGDFVKGFNCWCSCLKTTGIPSSRVLLDCGQASLNSISNQEEEALVRRAFIAWIILGMLIAILIAEVIFE